MIMRDVRRLRRNYKEYRNPRNKKIMDITELESSGKEDYLVIKSDKKGEDKKKE